ncbi:phosphate signaling complex protein PhoU [Roseimaritima sediminicola]|uniref:phosphate signaling complex protein PhoU n=1 Tax=Roseimaritima sediminicola TaxID=2662066 RepID=UPI00129846C7|nr:phosphate signaling complex protein PhoU [Roseimaritima sediminicola]
MTKHFQRDMERLHGSVLALSSRVEAMIDKAMLALCDRRMDLAAEVADEDYDVDQEEIRIEEECLKMLALHQPVAADLRRIAAVLKINNDLERIADLAVNICERSQGFVPFREFDAPPRLQEMSAAAVRMLRDALDCFVKLDASMARQIRLRDKEVNEHNVAIIEILQDMMMQDSRLVVPAVHCLSASRHLERIADLATNIAEDVIYLVEGEIVRHQHETIEGTPVSGGKH